MEMKNNEGKATGKGYNDCRLDWFEPRSDCKVDQYHVSKADTLWGIGESYCSEITEGSFGAYYIADYPSYPYYIVMYDSQKQMKR